MMQVNFGNVLLVHVHRLQQAKAWARRLGRDGEIEDEGEVIATVNAQGRIRDLDGAAILVT